MFNAAILAGNQITNVIVLNDLAEYPGAVICPEWLGTGDDITTPEPAHLVAAPTVQPISKGAQTL
jgi:hypothetical protein